MKIIPIKRNTPINFADIYPDVSDILENAFEHIGTYENAIDGVSPDDFKVVFGDDEPTNTFGGAFITSIYGTYVLHDLREEQIEWYENDPTLCTVVFYSLSKIEDDEE